MRTKDITLEIVVTVPVSDDASLVEGELNTALFEGDYDWGDWKAGGFQVTDDGHRQVRDDSEPGA